MINIDNASNVVIRRSRDMSQEFFGEFLIKKGEERIVKHYNGFPYGTIVGFSEKKLLELNAPVRNGLVVEDFKLITKNLGKKLISVEIVDDSVKGEFTKIDIKTCVKWIVSVNGKIVGEKIYEYQNEFDLISPELSKEIKRRENLIKEGKMRNGYEQEIMWF